MNGVRELVDEGRIAWIDDMAVWAADPDEVVRALAAEGFVECRKEVVKSRRDRAPAGGVWQGLNERTGKVASAVWINGAGSRRSIVFVDVDGVPLGR
jgi:hypothetical protein